MPKVSILVELQVTYNISQFVVRNIEMQILMWNEIYLQIKIALNGVTVVALSYTTTVSINHVDGLVRERCNSIANAPGLGFFTPSHRYEDRHTIKSFTWKEALNILALSIMTCNQLNTNWNDFFQKELSEC